MKCCFDDNKWGDGMIKNGFIIIMMITLFGSTGCSLSRAMTPEVSPAIQIQPAVTPFYKPPIPAEGSLWTDSANLLFTDNKARRVGDTITIDIIENTSSSLDANTETTRSTNFDAGITHFMGAMEKLREAHPDLSSDGKLIGATVANSFKGESDTDRKGQLTASIAARVMEVLPNGNLSLYGRREMKVNNETQHIVVSGIIRQGDIDSANHVKSTYLADAKIEYSGRGVLADKQKVGWMTRILDNVWPF